MGDDLGMVRRKGGAEVIGEPGWRYYSELPSGWNAVFPGIPDRGQTQPQDNRVSELFLRK